MSDKLKPCPFCGSDDLKLYVIDNNDGDYFSIECQGCTVAAHDEDREVLIKEWNNRPEKKYPGAMQVLKLQTKLDKCRTFLKRLADYDNELMPQFVNQHSNDVRNVARTLLDELDE